MSFDDFCRLLVGALGRDEIVPDPDVLIEADLGLDSLDLAELMLALEDAGVPIWADGLPQALTLGDLYSELITNPTADGSAGAA
jgi:acyl carrier protein